MAVIPYRPAIDGLRAIAVLGVVLYHLNSVLVPGGFVGVDIFFVISGFLLTQIIYVKCQQNTFSFGDFYRRRIARLLPVMILVTVFILIISGRIYEVQDFSSTGANAFASILSVSNIKLLTQGSYFEVNHDAVPFLHFWSLSLEEQFYIFLPLLIIGIFTLGLKYKSKIFTLFVCITVSYVACIWVSMIDPKFAFYLLPTRAWELLTGSILGIFVLCNPSFLNKHLPGPIKGMGVLLLIL